MMGLMERLAEFGKKKPSPEDRVPNMTVESAVLADLMQASRSTAKPSEKTGIILDENEGLPSVNRRKGGNKLVTILGFVFIIGAGLAMGVAFNGDGSDKDKSKKKPTPEREEKVASKLPPLVIPPVAMPPAPKAQAATAPPAAPAGQTSPPPKATPAPAVAGQGGKAPLHWSDRKMSGSVLAGKSGGTHGAYGSGAVSPIQPAPIPPGYGAPGPGGLTGAPDSSNELAAKLVPTITKAASASMLPDRNYLITKGTSLDCALETALDSSVPGLATCRLTRDVYSDNGHVLLLDRGTTLVGEYKSGLKQGQVRLFVLWTRAKTPHGVIIQLDSPGTDALGRSGLEGWVDNHFGKRFGAAILMSFVSSSVTALANSTGGSNNTNFYSNSAQSGEKVVEKILEATVNIPPTIVKNQGDHIQVMVARDLSFADVYSLEAIN